MAKKYLDSTGLATLWAKIKEHDTAVQTAAANDATSKDTAVKNELNTSITQNASDIATLKGRVDTFLAGINESDAAYDTLREIIDYIKSDTSGAAELLAKVNQNTTDIESIESNYLPLTGGSITGSIHVDDFCEGLLNHSSNEFYSGWGFNDADEPCLLNQFGRRLTIATDTLNGNYLEYEFPEKSGTVALTSDLSNYALTSSLSNYLPLTGGTVNGQITITDNTIEDKTTIINATEVKTYYVISSVCSTDELCIGENDEITITKDGISIGSYYLSYPTKSGTIALTSDIPTKTSQLTNDSGFLTEHQDLSGYLPLTGGQVTGYTYIHDLESSTIYATSSLYCEGSISTDYGVKVGYNGNYAEYKRTGITMIYDEETDQESQHILTYPQKSGTIALLSDIESSAEVTEALSTSEIEAICV